MALGDLLGGLFGGSAGKSDMKNAVKQQQQAVEQLRSLKVPEIEIQKIILQNPELAGMLDAEQVDGSALENVSVDPRLAQSRARALDEMMGLAQTGLGAEDVAAFHQLQRQSAAQAQAQAAQIFNQDAASGGRSGNALMAQLMAGQQAAGRAQQGGEALAANAAAARRQALSQAAELSNNMANSDFAQKAQIGNARDTINQFNAQQRTGAGQVNLQNKQNLENQRASNANQQEIYNKQLIQQKFNNEVTKAGGTAQQMNNMANTYSNQGQAAAQGQSQMMGSLIGAGASIGKAYAGKK